MESIRERALTAIKGRSDLALPKIRVYDLLKLGKVETWAGRCCDRIAESDLIDMEAVQIDFINPPGICLTADGIRICRDILGFFVDKDTLCDVFEWMRSEESINQDINTAVQVLRNMNGSGLRKLYQEAKSLQLTDSINVQELINEEIRQRSPLKGLIRKIKKEYRLIPVKRILVKTQRDISRR